VVPDQFGEEILKSEQGKIFSKQDSKAKIKQKLLQHFWWPTMEKSISNFLPNQQVPDETEEKGPNFRIDIDIFQMTTTSDQKDFVLCFTDRDTKYAELIAVNDDQAQTIATTIFVSWILRFGIPAELSLNASKNMRQSVFEQLQHMLDVNATFQPQLLRREGVANKKVEQYLLELAKRNTLNWQEYLPALMFCYNTSFQRSIKSTPYFATYGQHARQPAFSNSNLQQRYYGESSAADKFNILQLAKQIANELFNDQSTIHSETFNRQMAPHSFQKNDWVNFKGKGPYKIVQFKSHNNAILQSKNLKICVNIEHLTHSSESSFLPEAFTFQKEGGDQDFEEKKNKIQQTEKEERKENYRSKLRSHQSAEDAVNMFDIDAIDAMIEAEAEKSLRTELINENLISAVCIRTQMEKELKKMPKELIKKLYPSYWTQAQIINYQYSGDINEGPDEPGLISIEETGIVPAALYRQHRIPNPELQVQIPPVQPQELQVQPQPPQVQLLPPVKIGPNPFGLLKPQHAQPPDPPTPTTTTSHQEQPGRPQPDLRPPEGPRDPGPGTSSAEGQRTPVDRIRPELRSGSFEEARKLVDLNPEEKAYFGEAFDWELKLQEAQQMEARKAARSSFRFGKRPSSSSK
jgi:hypothetical protein